MNAKQFKKLIKDAVVEAMYEELPDMISEAIKQQNKQPLTEMKTINVSSTNVPTGKLPSDVRGSLMAQLGTEFGFQQPARTDLKVIDAVDQATGEKINPYAAFIADAAANMTPMDRSGLRQLD
jgi:hypothetical protein